MSQAASDGFSVHGVGVRIGDASLLHDISLDVRAGSWATIIGPSGSGKSTLLRLFNRLAEPSLGHIHWRGKELTEYDVQQLRREVALVVQQPRLQEGSVRDNLELPLRLAGELPADRSERLRRATELAGLPEALLHRSVTGLSGGERQRVAIARALMLQPRALLLDEPSAALDPSAARHLMDALNTLRSESGITLLMVTHRLAEARKLVDDVIVLDGGRIAEQGPASQVLTQPRSETARRLLDDALGRDRNDEPTD
jgi:ABC-type methionine transport system ATPase subunit